MPAVDLISKTKARAAAERTAFIETDEDGRERFLHHCFMGSIGADWSLNAVLQVIDHAHEENGVLQLGWMQSPYGRCLYVVAPFPLDAGADRLRPHLFDTVRP